MRPGEKTEKLLMQREYRAHCERIQKTKLRDEMDAVKTDGYRRACRADAALVDRKSVV